MLLTVKGADIQQHVVQSAVERAAYPQHLGIASCIGGVSELFDCHLHAQPPGQPYAAKLPPAKLAHLQPRHFVWQHSRIVGSLASGLILMEFSNCRRYINGMA